MKPKKNADQSHTDCMLQKPASRQKSGKGSQKTLGMLQNHGA